VKEGSSGVLPDVSKSLSAPFLKVTEECYLLKITQLPLRMERIDFPKRQVKLQRGLSSLSLTGAKPRFSRIGAITPQVNTREIQKSLKGIKM
jgi:hypothetical protein